MWKLLAQLIFKVGGWKIVGEYPKDIPRCVMVAGPHTSNWDFVYTRAAFYLLGVPLRFAIKKEFIDSPLGPLLKYFGAVSIDRQKKSKESKMISMVDAIANIINSSEKIALVITPEGTRKYNPDWKTGFYYIAKKAQVPVILGFLDYKNKEAGIGPIINLSDDVESDILKIKDFYRTKTGKIPENGVR